MKSRIAAARVRYVLALAALFCVGFAQAQEADEPQDLLIRNATLMDSGATAPDRMVSLLVRGGKLEIITEDAIPGEGIDEVVNANVGFIIGNLAIGEPPNR